MQDEDREIVDIVTQTMRNAMRKMRAARDGGPSCGDVVLTANEATIIYRMMTEVVGVRDATT